MKTNKLDTAVFKFTLIYAGIIFVICIGFNIALYLNTINSFGKHPVNGPGNEKPKPNITLEVEDFIKERDNEIKESVLIKLFVTDVLILISGAVGSYFLAKRTLKPIRDNMISQENFVANASHELRTPITAIIMENEVLLKDEKTSKQEYKKQIVSNLEEVIKMKYLVNNLLALSQTETLQLTSIDVNETIQEAIIRVEKQKKLKNITILNEIKGFYLEANREALIELFVILFDNAVKYGKDNGEIRIYVENSKICVQDNGIGINTEDIPRIFDKFYRADKAHSSEGYGLGLSLAKSLAAKMSLSLEVTSKEGVGTIFTIEKCKKIL